MKKYEIVKRKEEFNKIIQTGKYRKNKYFTIYELNHNVDLVELEPSKIIQEKQENLAVGNLPEVERKHQILIMIVLS